MGWIKNLLKNLLLLFIGCLLAFFLLEIFLRFYDPFEFRVKGDKIVLPANKEYIIENSGSGKLDKVIIHRKNSLGFRGEEPPEDFKNYLTIITVGGSTTENFLLSDDKTWSHILGLKLKKVFRQLWINNAGMTGHSTSGHIVLMEDHVAKLRPKVVLFLVGVNDIEKPLSAGMVLRTMTSMTNYSEVFVLSLNIYRYIKAMKMGVVWREINLNRMENLEVPEKTEMHIIETHKEKYLNAYEARLGRLITISKENGIAPVLITQPALFGDIIDDITNVNLAKIKTLNNINGKVAWEILELYNDIMRQVGKRENILVIDLAKELPKSSRYYHDFIHYSNDGAGKVAEIVYKHLCPFLKENFNEYLTSDCAALTLTGS